MSAASDRSRDTAFTGMAARRTLGGMHTPRNNPPPQQEDPPLPGSTHVAVRLDPEILTQVDTIVPSLSTSWHRATRSDALRFVIVEGLAALKAKNPQPARKAKRGAAR
jgi:hypothetical protein